VQKRRPACFRASAWHCVATGANGFAVGEFPCSEIGVRLSLKQCCRYLKTTSLDQLTMSFNMFGLGKPKEFGPVVVQGRQLACVVCGNGTFWEHEIQLATRGLNFFNVEEFGRLAQSAVCERCGYVHMFIPPATFKEDA